MKKKKLIKKLEMNIGILFKRVEYLINENTALNESLKKCNFRARQIF